MPNTPHSSRNRSASASRKAGSVIVAAISMGRAPSLKQTLHPGATQTIIPRIGATGGGIVKFAVLIGRSFRSFGVLRLLPLQLLQNGGFGILRQLVLEPVASAAEHNLRLRVQDPARLAAIGNEPVEERVGDDHDQQAAREPEQETERAVEGANAAVE